MVRITSELILNLYQPVLKGSSIYKLAIKLRRIWKLRGSLGVSSLAWGSISLAEH